MDAAFTFLFVLAGCGYVVGRSYRVQKEFTDARNTAFVISSLGKAKAETSKAIVVADAKELKDHAVIVDIRYETKSYTRGTNGLLVSFLMYPDEPKTPKEERGTIDVNPSVDRNSLDFLRPLFDSFYVIEETEHQLHVIAFFRNENDKKWCMKYTFNEIVLNRHETISCDTTDDEGNKIEFKIEDKL